jgi:hypothetical protein
MGLHRGLRNSQGFEGQNTKPCNSAPAFPHDQRRKSVGWELFRANYRIYPDALLCNQIQPGRCDLSRNGLPLYRDDDHLNETISAADLAPLIAKAIAEAQNWAHPDPEEDRK